MTTCLIQFKFDVPKEFETIDNEQERSLTFICCLSFIHSLFEKCWKMQSLLPFHVQALMMLKHKHELEVLLEDQQINIQDENSPTHLSLLDLQLCITMGDNKAAMNGS